MLFVAAFWRPNETPPWTFEAAMLQPEINCYVEGWGRQGDTGFIAVDRQLHPIGAAWLRLFRRTAPGYGFVDASIPEVTIAVKPNWRGKGVGSTLLDNLMEAAFRLGFTDVSLSVSEDNPAVRLYERKGFRRLEQVGGSWTMLARLGPPPVA